MSIIKDVYVNPLNQELSNDYTVYTCLELEKERVCVTISKSNKPEYMYVMDVPRAQFPEIYSPQKGQTSDKVALRVVVCDVESNRII